MQDRKKAYLLLANGKIFEGYSMGQEGSVIGEIVFATAMTGYQETLTDPSYYGQIVTQTFPLIGNYGVNDEDYESDKCYLTGYIVREWCDYPSNFRSHGNINDFLVSQNVIGICGIDTRALTRIIRENGVMNGLITTVKPENIDELLTSINNYKIVDAVKSVSNPNRREKASKTDPAMRHVVLMDFGYKRNILTKLRRHGCDVTVVPYDTTAKEIKELNPDGIMLSNGPGDPSENIDIIESLKEIIKLAIPIFGICLGHQLMALANGGSTIKLKYGHRGANQPVTDVTLDKTFVTSQNHGYAVLSDTIDESVGTISHVNANDGSCEGVIYKNSPAFTVQFHPEAKGGPLDTAYLFDKFMAFIDEHNNTNKGGQA